jgi:formylglycine-generating enzyme required for sulfatase activity
LDKRPFGLIAVALECAMISRPATPAPDAGYPDGATTANAYAKEAARHSCPPGMMYIPAGETVVAYDGTRAVPAFCMDILETTVADYKQCVRAGRCKKPDNRPERAYEIRSSYWRKGSGNIALDCVDFYNAEAYCRFRDKRLPKPREWFRAAAGDRDLFNPWGDAVILPGGVCWERKEKQGPCEVGTSNQDVSPFGIRDMGANAVEWTSRPDLNLGHAPWRSEAILGDSWRNGPDVLGTATSKPIHVDLTYQCAGIRCVLDANGDGTF